MGEISHFYLLQKMRERRIKPEIIQVSETVGCIFLSISINPEWLLNPFNHRSAFIHRRREFLVVSILFLISLFS